MKTQNDNFEENLAVGTIGEDIVYEYLVRNNSFVEDCRNQKHTENSGPRLRGTEGTLILPDFIVYNKNLSKGNFAIDVKVKRSIYPFNGKLCFTVDNKFEDYKRIVQIKKLDFLSIIFIYDNKLYLYKDTDICGTHIYNNKYSTGNVYLFEFDETKQVY